MNSENEVEKIEESTEVDNSEKISVNSKNFMEIEGRFMLVKVGTSEQPAADDEIEKIEKKLKDLFENNGINCVAFVTHHAVDITMIS